MFENRSVQDHVLRFYSQPISVGGKAYTVQVAAPMNEAFEALSWFPVILVLAAPLLS